MRHSLACDADTWGRVRWQPGRTSEPELTGLLVAAPQVMEAVCRQVAAEVRLYQESIRSQEELMDTTGVELVQGRTSGKARPMLVIKQEKLDRAANYARVSCRRLYVCACMQTRHVPSTQAHVSQQQAALSA